MLAPAFSITYNGTCDGKLLALFLSYYEQHIARPSLRLADTDAKSWLYRGSGPDHWDWNRGQHHYLQMDAVDAAESAAWRRAGGAHRGHREHGAGGRADHDVSSGLPRFPRQSEAGKSGDSAGGECVLCRRRAAQDASLGRNGVGGLLRHDGQTDRSWES